jgi:hypothetical protein
MAMLVHEIWEEIGERGETLPGVCHAGPAGDGYRKLRGPNARLVWTFEAGSHFEAMTIYYRYYGWGDYTTEFAIDYEPYPDAWAEQQRRGC